MRITAFKIQKPKRFEYTPRYYNPVTELRKERERRAMRELENEKGDSFTPADKQEMGYQIRFNRPKSRRISKGGFLMRVITFVLALTVALLVFYGTWVLVKLV